MWRTRSELCKICKLTAFINYCPVQYITVFVQRISRRPGIEALVRLPLRHLYIVPFGGGRFVHCTIRRRSICTLNHSEAVDFYSSRNSILRQLCVCGVLIPDGPAFLHYNHRKVCDWSQRKIFLV